MLQDLQDLALERGNEPKFRAFGEMVQGIKSTLRQECNTALKERAIDTFFKPIKAKEGKKSKDMAADDGNLMPIEISDSDVEMVND